MAQEPRTVLVAVADPRMRQRLRDQLDRRHDVVFLAEAGEAEEAVRVLREIRPDIALLDVRLSGGDGFGVVKEVGAEEMPVVVFITALDSHALRALEVHALDYLLEPFDDDSFHAAIDRAMRYAARFALEGLGRRLQRLLDGDEEGSRERRIQVPSAGQVQYVPLDEVRWVEAAGSFARLHLYDGKTHLLRESLGTLAERFADGFFRIHRSTLVRSSEVAEIRRDDDGDALVVLRDGSELRVSREYRDNLEPISRSRMDDGGSC